MTHLKCTLILRSFHRFVIGINSDEWQGHSLKAIRDYPQLIFEFILFLGNPPPFYPKVVIMNVLMHFSIHLSSHYMTFVQNIFRKYAFFFFRQSIECVLVCIFLEISSLECLLKYNSFYFQILVAKVVSGIFRRIEIVCNQNHQFVLMQERVPYSWLAGLHSLPWIHYISKESITIFF